MQKKIEKSLRSQYRREALAEGLTKGRAEGHVDEKNSIAKKLKENNVDIEIISKSTGLTKDEIENL